MEKRKIFMVRRRKTLENPQKIKVPINKKYFITLFEFGI